jgi:hypothetical protein
MAEILGVRALDAWCASGGAGQSIQGWALRCGQGSWSEASKAAAWSRGAQGKAREARLQCVGAAAWLGVRAAGAVGGRSPGRGGAHARVRVAAVGCGGGRGPARVGEEQRRRSHTSASRREVKGVRWAELGRLGSLGRREGRRKKAGQNLEGVN